MIVFVAFALTLAFAGTAVAHTQNRRSVDCSTVSGSFAQFGAGDHPIVWHVAVNGGAYQTVATTETPAGFVGAGTAIGGHRGADRRSSTAAAGRSACTPSGPAVSRRRRPCTSRPATATAHDATDDRPPPRRSRRRPRPPIVVVVSPAPVAFAPVPPRHRPSRSSSHRHDGIGRHRTVRRSLLASARSPSARVDRPRGTSWPGDVRVRPDDAAVPGRDARRLPGPARRLPGLPGSRRALLRRLPLRRRVERRPRLGDLLVGPRRRGRRADAADDLHGPAAPHRPARTGLAGLHPQAHRRPRAPHPRGRRRADRRLRAATAACDLVVVVRGAAPEHDRRRADRRPARAPRVVPVLDRAVHRDHRPRGLRRGRRQHLRPVRRAARRAARASPATT